MNEIKDMDDIMDYAFKYNVQKSNTLVLSSIFDFSEIEMDMANFLTVLVKPPEEDYETKELKYELTYEVDFSTLCHLTGTMRNGKTYKDYANAIERLRRKSVAIKLENGNYAPFFFISDWEYDNRRGVAIVKISEKMIPYIMDLKTKYLTYKSLYTFLMKGKYPKRLYEEFKAVLNASKRKSVIYQPRFQAMKERLNITSSSYSSYSSFEQKILRRAVEEINRRSDITVTYTPIREKNKVTEIKFIIVAKNVKELKIVDEENKKMIERTNYEPSNKTILDIQDFE